MGITLWPGEMDAIRHLHVKGEKWREAARRRRRRRRGGGGEGKVRVLLCMIKMLALSSGFSARRPDITSFSTCHSNPFHQDTQAEGGCLTPSWVRVKGLAFYLSLYHGYSMLTLPSTDRSWPSQGFSNGGPGPPGGARGSVKHFTEKRKKKLKMYF